MITGLVVDLCKKALESMRSIAKLTGLKEEILTRSMLEDRIAWLSSRPWGRPSAERFRNQLADLVIAEMPEEIAKAQAAKLSSIVICKIDSNSVDMTPPVRVHQGVIELGAERLLSPAYLRMMGHLNAFTCPLSTCFFQFSLVGFKHSDPENAGDTVEFKLVLDFTDVVQTGN